MSMTCDNAVVVENRRVSSDYYLLEAECPGVSSSARPGQFVHVRVPGDDLVLRRPFSICEGGGVSISVLYKVVGEGTRRMASLQRGGTVNILGPLGNGFDPAVSGSRPLLVGGGYGVAPLLFLAKNMRLTGVLAVGGRSSEDILFCGEFESLGWEVRVATEDGSLGQRGVVTEVFVGSGKKDGISSIYACGPDGMLRAVCKYAENKGLRAWISLDRHMGCGVGACLACVCRIRDDKGEVHWGRVCRDGPVFECRNVVWEKGAREEP
jgi:dihydroorotate dehydrogenase electron transfer subunit